MDKVHWGTSSDKPSRKRDRCDESEQEIVNGNKRPKWLKNDDTDIYVIDREIHFTAEINSDTIERIIKKITKIIHKNENKFVNEKLTIVYIVDSPGGCVTSILKFVDFINMVRKKHTNVEFVSIITGLVASAGTIMCMVADKRLMTKNAHAMIHELTSGNRGKYTQLKSYGVFITSLHESLLNIYLENTNLPKDEIERLLATETWFDAKTYKEHGFVHEIIA